jgi:ADP-ribosyl-[dinitrogen reductase] hydrolase
VTDPLVKTSENSPIRVDFIAGRSLGLTFAPGKHGGSQVGNYVWQRDLDSDVQRLRDHYDVDCIFTLIEDYEFELLKIPTLRDAIRAHGMKSDWFPIPDGGVPTSTAEIVATVRTARSAIATGERVVLHCRGGLGRAGTVAACILISLGETADDAIVRVREARPRAIENARQELFVEQFAAFWTGEDQ